MPYRVFQVNEVLTASNVNTYLAQQAIATFSGTAARASSIGTPVNGQFAFLNDTNTLTYYSTAVSNWVEFSAGGGATGFETNFLLMGA